MSPITEILLECILYFYLILLFIFILLFDVFMEFYTFF